MNRTRRQVSAMGMRSKIIRQLFGITAYDVERQSGGRIACTTVYRLEGGYTQGISDAEGLANGLGISVDTLLDYSIDPQSIWLSKQFTAEVLRDALKLSNNQRKQHD